MGRTMVSFRESNDDYESCRRDLIIKEREREKEKETSYFLGHVIFIIVHVY